MHPGPPWWKGRRSGLDMPISCRVLQRQPAGPGLAQLGVVRNSTIPYASAHKIWQDGPPTPTRAQSTVISCGGEVAAGRPVNEGVQGT
jgi:hypothetical protein